MISNDELFKALHSVTLKRESSRTRILIELFTVGTGLSQRVLGDNLDIKPATVSEQLDILMAAKFVTKHIDMIDKRISIITLTESGREEAQKLIAEREDRLEEMFSDLSKEEKSMLYSLVTRIKR